jgi:glucose/arabinose dehydrogenase
VGIKNWLKLSVVLVSACNQGGPDGPSGGAPSHTGGSADNGGSAANGGSSAGEQTGGAAGAAIGGASASSTGGSEAQGGAPSSGGGGGLASMLADPCRGAMLSGTAYVPEGMCARVVATGVSNVRQLSFSSDGALWATSSDGAISRLMDTDGDGQFGTSEITEWATSGGNGQNVHIDEAGGFLYAGTPTGVKRWAWSKTLAAGGPGEDVLTGQPGEGGHSKHTVKLWDGWLYVMSGSSENVVDPDSPAYDTKRSQIKRFKLSEFESGTPFDWLSDGEVFANGLRNTLGFNQDAMGRIYGVQNGQDKVEYGGADVHQDNPGEVIVRLDAGTSHGYPFCFVAQSVSGVEPGMQVASAIFPNNPHDDTWCQNPANALPPVTFVQAHTAPMDIVFYTGPFGALPDKWKSGAFVSLHGSWNRTTATGYKVVWVPFNADGTAPLPTNSGSTTNFTFEVVFGKTADKVANSSEEWTDGQQVRPVGIAVSPTDGALYISSDENARIYRVGLQQR